MRIARTTRLPRASLVVALGIGLPLIAASAAAACAAPGRQDPPGPPGGAGATADRLVVSVDDGAGTVTTYDLECEGPVAIRGTHSDAQAACERLEGLGGPTAPAPRGTFCTQLYGGPQTAHVTGTWHGAPVDASYSRRDGCEIGRWTGMIPVLPDFRAKAGEGT